MLAAGLTLIFGIMGLVKLALASFCMLGAYLTWSLDVLTGSLMLAIIGGAVRRCRRYLVCCLLCEGTTCMAYRFPSCSACRFH